MSSSDKVNIVMKTKKQFREERHKIILKKLKLNKKKKSLKLPFNWNGWASILLRLDSRLAPEVISNQLSLLLKKLKPQ